MNGPTTTSVASPCILVCRLDECDLCVGCLRTRREIALWGEMSDGEKQAVLEVLALRRLNHLHRRMGARNVTAEPMPQR